LGAITEWNVSEDFHGWVKKAETGDIEAQYAVAHHIISELSPDKNEKELIDRAVKYYRNAAMSGYFHGIAAEELGSLYYEGRFVEQDYSKAIMWFRTSLNKLMPVGYFHLGRCFYYGHGVEQDFAKAFDSYFKGAITGYINNYILLGDMYMHGEFVDKDAEFAVRLYQYVCDVTESEHEEYGIWSDAYGPACLRLGAAYLFGVGVMQDIDEANYLLSEAKEHVKDSPWVDISTTDAETKKLLCLLDEAPYPEDYKPETPAETETAGVVLLSDKEFVELIIERLPKYELALSHIGVCYATGNGVDKDYLKAYGYFVKMLLLEPDKGGKTYEDITTIYPHLACFEKDKGFLEYCRKKAMKSFEQSI